jgi:hypothetical protein
MAGSNGQDQRPAGPYAGRAEAGATAGVKANRGPGVAGHQYRQREPLSCVQQPVKRQEGLVPRNA